MTREQFDKMSNNEIAEMIRRNDEENRNRINRELDHINMAYKVQDIEGNTFVYAGMEGGFPVYRGSGGSKHISDMIGLTVIEQYLNID